MSSVFPQPVIRVFSDYPGSVKKVVAAGGLSKRELFAAMAMQALVTGLVSKTAPMSPEDIAQNAVFLADALIDKLQE